MDQIAIRHLRHRHHQEVKNIWYVSPSHQFVKRLESFMNHASDLVKLSADKETAPK